MFEESKKAFEYDVGDVTDPEQGLIDCLDRFYAVFQPCNGNPRARNIQIFDIW